MMDLKRTNTENQANNIGLVRPPFRRPYQLSQYQTPPNNDGTLNFEEIYSIFKALTTGSQTIHDDTRDNSKEAEVSEPPSEEQDQHINIISFFYELAMFEEE